MKYCTLIFTFLMLIVDYVAGQQKVVYYEVSLSGCNCASYQISDYNIVKNYSGATNPYWPNMYPSR